MNSGDAQLEPIRRLLRERRLSEASQRLEETVDGSAATGIRASAFVYLGYIDDLSDRREEAIAKYTAAAQLGDHSGLAKAGLEQPLLWIRHIDAMDTTRKSVATKLSAEEKLKNIDVLCLEVSKRSTRLKSKNVPWSELCSAARGEAANLAQVDDFYALLFRLVAGLRDSHTWFVNFPQRFLQYGIGASCRCEGHHAFVARVSPRSPADAAGLRPGMEILAVDGKTPDQARVDHVPLLPGASSDAAARVEICASLLQANVAFPAELSVREVRPERRSRLSVPRDKLIPPRPGPPELPIEGRGFSGSIQWAKTALGFGVIRFLDFENQDGSGLTDFKTAVGALKEVRGLVLDLRGNPGGYGSTPRRVAKILPKLPLAAIIDDSTQSAAELFASYLKQKGVLIVGSPSAGLLGGHSEEIVLPCGLKLRLEHGEVLDRDGKMIEGRGVQPDMLVEETENDRENGKDRQLEAALAALEKKSAL